MKTKLLLLLTLAAVLPSCSRNREPQVSEQDIRRTEEALIGANRLMLQKDKEKIMNYIRENRLSLTETQSGLWYGIMQTGKGRTVKENDMITMAYQVSLLDGTVCYSSQSQGVKQFRVGKGGVESGLEEGVVLLNEGSKALFILPPHLAHGLTGDGDKIPARSVIVYSVEVLNLEP